MLNNRREQTQNTHDNEAGTKNQGAVGEIEPRVQASRPNTALAVFSFP